MGFYHFVRRFQIIFFESAIVSMNKSKQIIIMLQKPKLLLSVFAIILSLILLGQSTSSNLDINKYLQNVPASPNAAALTKYVGATVSLNAGMVRYNVPIYEIKYHDIHIPIGLNYAINGIRVNEA